MLEIEGWVVTQIEMIKEFENTINSEREDKYTFQVGLVDLKSNVNEEQLKNLGLAFPFQSINQAEDALKSGAMQPTVSANFPADYYFMNSSIRSLSV
ncbi:MAG: hypothetical protein KAS38_07595 [Anaerolineales bacterium]|nr:hypothetical protein [Anaerolineales bacterium]